MKEMLLSQLFSLAMGMLSEETIRAFADALLDKVEVAIKESENTLDDKIVGLMCARVREVFDIPDNDE